MAREGLSGLQLQWCALLTTAETRYYPVVFLVDQKRKTSVLKTAANLLQKAPGDGCVCRRPAEQNC